MEDNKVQQLLKELEQYRLELSGDADASKEFLVDSGIINNEGQLETNFKHLCTPLEQD